MIEQDKKRFSEIMLTTASLYGKEPSKDFTRAFWGVLKSYDIAEVEQAFARHIKSSKFFPVPAEIIGLIPSENANQHIGADEAWGIVLESFDEESTVVVTAEIMHARDAVMDIYHDGDKTGARMAFRSAYERIIASASATPSWFISAGFDGARRVDAIEKAVSIGRLTRSSGKQFLLGTDKPTATVAGLLESAEKEIHNRDSEFREKSLRNIGALKAVLA